MVRVLLVEDNEMNRDMLSRRLGRKGFEVVMAEDGAQALEMAISEAPALILMDMNLPVIDGWEATRRLKAQAATAAIPVIGLTAHAMDGDREACLQAGCDDYDTKPVDLPRLLDKMTSQLTRCGVVVEG
jgi:CheY-like chemotaxis protein